MSEEIVYAGYDSDLGPVYRENDFKYTGPADNLKLNNLTTGMRVLFRWNDHEYGCGYGVIEGIKRFGYPGKKSIKIREDNNNLIYLCASSIIRIITD